MLRCQKVPCKLFLRGVVVAASAHHASLPFPRRLRGATDEACVQLRPFPAPHFAFRQLISISLKPFFFCFCNGASQRTMDLLSWIALTLVLGVRRSYHHLFLSRPPSSKQYGDGPFLEAQPRTRTFHACGACPASSRGSACLWERRSIRPCHFRVAQRPVAAPPVVFVRRVQVLLS